MPFPWIFNQSRFHGSRGRKKVSKVYSSLKKNSPYRQIQPLGANHWAEPSHRLKCRVSAIFRNQNSRFTRSTSKYCLNSQPQSITGRTIAEAPLLLLLYFCYSVKWHVDVDSRPMHISIANKNDATAIPNQYCYKSNDHRICVRKWFHNPKEEFQSYPRDSCIP